MFPSAQLSGGRFAFQPPAPVDSPAIIPSPKQELDPGRDSLLWS